MLIFYSMQLFLVTNSATATTFPSALSTSTAPPSAVAAASAATAATPTVSGLPVPSLASWRLRDFYTNVQLKAAPMCCPMLLK